MDGVYNCMQSYPYQRDQMHYWPHHTYPGTEAVPTQMYPARSPVNYECWPWGSNYGYACPVVCHGCGNHNYLPNHYAWRSPYSHAPPVHGPGSYPFPIQYMSPPPYAMQQPQYEYEKNMPRDHHCCGCPNHLCHRKEQKNVKIEEEEPDGERRKNESLVPSQFKSYPYPIVWLPPDYEHGKLNKSKYKDGEDGFLDAKPHESRKHVEQQPAPWNKWYPNDLRNLGLSNQKGDGERNHHEENDGRGLFPYPIIWMPYEPDEKGKEAHKVNNANPEPSLESVKGPDVEKHFNVNGEHTGGQASHRSKDIPVKEVEQHEGKESSSIKEKERDAPVKGGTDNGEMKSPKDSSKRKSSPSPKSSKLPPVCLRVDPLPRRKSANGSSRSPSPPGDKQKLDQLSNEASKVVTSSQNEKSGEITKNESKEGKGITKTIEVADGRRQGEISDVNVGAPVNLPVKCLEKVSPNQIEEKAKEENISHECSEPGETVIKGQSKYAGSAEGEKGEFIIAKDATEDEAKESSKRKLSNEEAALIIQSAYRGFVIRRWEPLKKLKQIAKVREQIATLKHQIQAMESSSDIQSISKQRTIIAETIMSLLLELDMIQGLHPSIREIRKSVVRELVSLQEKLDSLSNEKSEASPEPELFMRNDEEAFKETVDVTSSLDGKESHLVLQEPSQNQLEGESRCEDMKISEKNLIGEQMSEKFKMEGAELSETQSGPIIGKEDSEEVREDDEASVAKKMEDHEEPVVGKTCELSFLQNNSSVQVTDFEPPDGDKLGSDSAELLQGVSGDSYTPESTNNAASEEDFIKADQEKQPEEVLKEASITSESKDAIPNQIDQVLDRPLNENNVKSEAEETSPMNGSLENCKMEDKFETVEEVDNIIGDASFKPDESSAQLPQNVIADIFEPSEASDHIELSTEAASKGKDAIKNEENAAREISNTTEITSEASDNIELSAEEASKGKDAIENEENAAREILNTTEITSENASKSPVYPTSSQVSVARDELIESNGKLIEENERLRNMMEKLIKSGEQQLITISNLSGRVKDLERKLSRNKKLKMKRYRAPRSGSARTTKVAV